MMVLKKIIILLFILLLGQISDSSNDIKEKILRHCKDNAQEIEEKIVQLTQESLQTKKLLDGCHHVYLDIGTNIGIQIRKLYEPKKYDAAPVHDIFNKYFHRNIEDLNSTLPYICAIGIEPNPNHEQKLKKLNVAYNKCNWNVKVWTQTAASNHEGRGEFISDNNFPMLELGGTIFDRSKVYGTKLDTESMQHFVRGRSVKDNENRIEGDNIQLIRLATFINEEVGQRQLPKNIDEKTLGKPSVVMKLDIEGSEVEVIEDLIMQGSLQYIDVMLVEYHTRLAKTEDKKKPFKDIKDIISKIGELSEYLNKHRENKVHSLKVLEFDDETYAMSDYSLPVC